MKPRRRTDEAAAASVPEPRRAEETAPADELPEPDDTVDSDAPAEPATLSERAKRVLDFERKWWRHAGAKEQAIREEFGLSATRYYQVLNALLEDPAALAYDAVLVGRLRRLRASRSRRSSG